jgi:hypothetical protein
MKMYVQRCGCTALAACRASLAYLALTTTPCSTDMHAGMCGHGSLKRAPSFAPIYLSGPVMPRTRAVRVRVQGLGARFMPGRTGSGGADGFIKSGRLGAKGGYTGTWVGDEIRGAVGSVVAILRV